MKKTNCNGTTHAVCNKRLEKEGGKANCCFCNPHNDCEFTQKTNDEDLTIETLTKEALMQDKDSMRFWLEDIIECIKRQQKEEIESELRLDQSILLNYIFQMGLKLSDEKELCKRINEHLEKIKSL